MDLFQLECYALDFIWPDILLSFMQATAESVLYQALNQFSLSQL